jgi:hypothetical protein
MKIHSLFLIALCVITSVLACMVSGCQGREPKKLFSVFIADPIPESVEILHGREDEFLDMAAFLHFRIDPADIPVLLASRKWERGHQPKVSTGPSSGNPDWWKPNELSRPAFYRWEKDPSNEFNGESAEMWINAEKNEVYFFYFIP